MTRRFDIFRTERDGGVIWRESMTTLEHAKARIEELLAGSPGEYLVVNQQTGEHIVIHPGSTDKSTESDSH